MAIFKCKICGGDLDVREGQSVCMCEYCGTRQTVPRMDNEKKILLFTRANRLRTACEFDKASGIYESLVTEFPKEAEAYWGLILCRYGIEYVDDPLTGRKVPTCHRTSFERVTDDPNYEMVMACADPVARDVYRDEAAAIEKLREGIIAVSSREEPYDIFICYKETDADGDRTIDSLTAERVYNALTEKGYRVFFSRITLEDKLGQEYEPYIFAALQSAKIMLVFGSDTEFLNAVWVRNEWSRYLSLIAKGEKKTLIPCYLYMDPYDLPREFQHLQSQNMEKVGADEDLIRGIGKIIGVKNGQAGSQANTVIRAADDPSRIPLQQMESCIVKLRDYRKAEELAQGILKTMPDVYEAWWGLIRIRTQDMTTCDTRNSVWRELDGYADKVLRLAPEPQRAEYVRKWNAFLQLRQNIRTQRMQAISARQAEVTDLRQRYQARVDPVQERIKQITKKAYDRTRGSRKTGKRICFVVSVLLVAGLVKAIASVAFIKYFIDAFPAWMRWAAAIVLVLVLGYALGANAAELLGLDSYSTAYSNQEKKLLDELESSIREDESQISQLSKELETLQEQYAVASGEEIPVKEEPAKRKASRK